MPGTRRLSLSLLLLLPMLWCGLTSAATINVPADYGSIQAAIDAAVDSDVIIVAARSYAEHINFKGKSITVRSTDPTDSDCVSNTIIDGADAGGSMVTFATAETSAAVLSGFTIMRGTGTNVGGNYYGGGIYCSGSSPTITHNVIRHNTLTSGGPGSWSLGGGIFSADGAPIIHNNSISSNQSDGDAGGIFLSPNGRAPSLQGNTIAFNSATGTGGKGGGVLLASGLGTISDSTFIGNTATAGAGLFCDSSSPSIDHCVITENTASDSGGGIRCDDGAPIIDQNTITDNVATNEGGGIYCSIGTPGISGNTVDGNEALYGAGIYCNNAAATISQNLITDNRGTGAENGGGGISCRECSPVITENRIIGNSAVYGGGIRSYDASPNMTHNVICGNTATNGGGVRCMLGSPVLENCTLSGNSATNRGGGVCSDSTLTIRNCIIVFSGNGEGVYRQSSTVTTTYSDVHGNADDDYGGGAAAGTGCLDLNPAFASLLDSDFHLQSRTGRWNGTAWVTDPGDSVCIDAGDPATAFNNEPSPNGGRVNMGAYGNTAEASKSVGPPSVIAWEPTGTDCTCQSPIIKVTFDQAMDQRSAQNALSITPEVGGKFSWVGNQMCFAIGTALAPATSYEVRIKTSARSAAGLSMAKVKRWTFTTDSRPAIARGRPVGQTVNRNSAIRVVFNQPMNQGVTEGAFFLAPARVGTFSWDGNAMIYTPSKALAWDREYQVTVTAAALGENGLNMGANYSWTFRTTPRPLTAPAVTVAAAPTAGGVQIVTTLSAPAAVQASICNMAGRAVALLPERNLPEGTSTLLWDGRSSSGTQVPAGAYLVRVTARTEDGQQSQALAVARVP